MASWVGPPVKNTLPPLKKQKEKKKVKQNRGPKTQTKEDEGKCGEMPFCFSFV